MAATSLGLFAILIFALLQISSQDNISDQKLCGNKFCTVTLSLAKAITDYSGSQVEPKLLKFKANDVVKITSKSAGSRQDLWGGEVRGIEGFFPKSMVKEFKVFQHNPAHVITIVKDEKDKKESDDETEFDDTELDAQDIVKPEPKEEPKKEETKDDKSQQKETDMKPEESKEAAAPKEEKPLETEKGEKEPEGPKKVADETEIDETEVADSPDPPAPAKADEKSPEAAEKTSEQPATDETKGGTAEQQAEKPAEKQKEEAAKSTDKPVEQSSDKQETKGKTVDKISENESENSVKERTVESAASDSDDKSKGSGLKSDGIPTDPVASGQTGEDVKKDQLEVDNLAKQSEKPVDHKKDVTKVEAEVPPLSQETLNPTEHQGEPPAVKEEVKPPIKQAEVPTGHQRKIPEVKKEFQPPEGKMNVEPPSKETIKSAEHQEKVPDAKAEVVPPVKPKPAIIPTDPQQKAPEAKAEVKQPGDQAEVPVEPQKKADSEHSPVEVTGVPMDQGKEPEGKTADKPDDQTDLAAILEEQHKDIPAEPPTLKIADIRVTVGEPDAINHQHQRNTPQTDKLDLAKQGAGLNMDVGNVPENKHEAKKDDLRVEEKPDAPRFHTPYIPKPADPRVIDGIPKIKRRQLSDDDLKELRSKYVKRRLASVGQAQVQPVDHESLLADDEKSKDSATNSPAEAATGPPVVTETKIEPTLTQESVEASKTVSADSKPDVTGTPHPPATEVPAANHEEPKKEPHEPIISSQKSEVKEEPSVDPTPSLQPTLPAGTTESTELTEDDLKSQKLLEELERGPTDVPNPGAASSQVESTPQVTTSKSIEPSLPHEVPPPVVTKHIKPTPRIVLPGMKTIIPNEINRLKPPEKEDIPIGTAVKEKPAESTPIPQESIQPTSTDTHHKGTVVTEAKPDIPQAADTEKPPTDQVPLTESEKGEPHVPTVEQQQPPATEPTPQSDSDPVESTMSTLTKTAEPLVGAIIGSLPEEWRLILEKEPIGLPPTHTVLFLLICLIFSFIVSIKCMCGGGDKATVKLKERLQKVEYELFVSNKEKESLSQSIHEAEDKASTSTSSMSTYEETNKRLQLDVSNSQLHNSALKKSVHTLEEKTSTLSHSFETVQMSLAQKEQESIEFQNQVYQLQEHTNQLEYQVQQAQELLLEKQKLSEELEGSSSALNEEVTLLQQSKQQLLVEADDWNEKVKELGGTVNCMEGQVKDLQDSVSFKENEIEVLKDCFMQLKVLEAESENENDESGGESENTKLQEKVAAMMNVSRMNAILQQLEEDKASLNQKLVIESESRQEMEEQMKNTKQELEMFKMNHSKAERESAESMTKLNVLSTYFKEKELQMQKELGEQLTQKKAKEGQLEQYGEKTQEIEQEMSMYRSQVDDLKKEITNIERDFRNQIATNEKKAHENWLTARAAERDLKEAKADSAILRQKLTDIERRREFMDREGLIRPLPTRGLPPMMMNGPPPPGPPPPGAPDRPLSRSSGPQPSPSPHHHREGELGSPNFDRLPPPPMDRRPFLPPDRPMLPPGRLPMDRPLPPPLDRRMPPPMMDMRSPPPLDRRPMDPSPPFGRDPDRHYPPPPERFPPDRRSPPFRQDMPPPPRMGPGGPPYPGPPMRGPPPPRREPFPPEPYPERQGPKSTSTPKR